MNLVAISICLLHTSLHKCIFSTKSCNAAEVCVLSRTLVKDGHTVMVNDLCARPGLYIFSATTAATYSKHVEFLFQEPLFRFRSSSSRTAFKLVTTFTSLPTLTKRVAPFCSYFFDVEAMHHLQCYEPYVGNKWLANNGFMMCEWHNEYRCTRGTYLT